MAGVNSGRLLIGGVVAGIVMVAGDTVANMYLMAEESFAMVQRLSLDAAAMQTTSAMASMIGVDLVLGLLLVFNYAGMRPRFGPGPMTAVISSFVIYAALTAVMYTFAVMGIFTMAAFVKSSLIYFVIMTAAGLAGAKVYSE